MKRLFLLAAVLAAMISPSAFAYSETKETLNADWRLSSPRHNPPASQTQRERDRWFEKERMKTDGYTEPRIATADGNVTCPTPAQASRDREFMRQLQLTDGVRDWPGDAGAGSSTRLAGQGSRRCG